MQLPVIEPMKLSRVAVPFDDPAFLYELKHDGFRSLAYIENGQCRLVSRRRNVYKSFEALRISLGKLRAKDAILDGELVCLDARGDSQFKPLLNRRAEPVFYAFDLVWLNGKDLRQLPLVERKEKLRRLIDKSDCPDIICAKFIEGRGTALFKEICDRDLEGIVCKRKSSVYSGKRPWLKVKNPNYSQAEGRHEKSSHRSEVGQERDALFPHGEIPEQEVSLHRGTVARASRRDRLWMVIW